MISQWMRDKSYRYNIKPNECFRQNKYFYTLTLAYSATTKQAYYLFMINLPDIKQKSYFDLYYNELIYHKQDTNSPSKLSIQMLSLIVYYLREVGMYEQQQILQMFQEYKFSSEVCKAIIQYSKNQEQQNIFNYYGLDYDIKTNKGQNSEQIEYLLSNFNNQSIINQFQSIDNFNEYKQAIKTNVKSQKYSRKQFTTYYLIRKLQYLSPLYNFSFTQGQYDHKNYIIVQQYDKYKFLSQLSSQIPNSQTSEQKQENLVSLHDILFYQEYITAELSPQSSTKMQFSATKLINDLIKQLIMYQSLTKQPYPSLNPLNIMYNTAVQRFYLAIQPVIINYMGYDLNNLPISYNHQKQIQCLQNYHAYFNSDNEQKVSALIANINFYEKRRISLLTNENLKRQLQNSYRIKQKRKQDVTEFCFKNKIKQNQLTFLRIDKQYKCKAVGIDLGQSRNNFYWLKHKISVYLLKKLQQQNEYSKIVIQIVRSYQFLGLLQIFLFSNKLKYRRLSKNCINSLQPQQIQQIVTEDLKPIIKQLEQYRSYLQKYKLIQATTLPRKITYLNFDRIELSLANLVKKIMKTISIAEEQKILVHILITTNQKCFDKALYLFNQTIRITDKTKLSKIFSKMHSILN